MREVEAKFSVMTTTQTVSPLQTEFSGMSAEPNLVSPTGALKRRSTLPVEPPVSAPAPSSKPTEPVINENSTEVVRKRFFTVSSNDKETFVLPTKACQTWQELVETLKEAFAKVPASVEALDKGNFVLRNEDGIIMPKHWVHLLGDASRLSVNLNSTIEGAKEETEEAKKAQADKEEMEAEKAQGDQVEVGETRYEMITQYTYEYWQKERYGDDTEYLFEKKYDQATLIDFVNFKKPSVLPVLEHKTSIVLAHHHEASVIEKIRKSDHARPLELGDVPGLSKVKIHSEYLLNLLRAVMEFSLSVADGTDLDQGLFTEPYMDLYRHKNALLDYKDGRNADLRSRHSEDYNQKCDQHIDILVKYLYSQPRVELKQWEDQLEKKTPAITFAYLWLLLKPGDDVYVKEDGQLNAYVIDYVEGGLSKVLRVLGMPVEYVVHVWNLINDGRCIRRQSQRIVIPVFDYEKEITTLPVFPVRFHDVTDGCSLRKDLIERGKMYFECAKGPAYMEYSGNGLKPGWKKYQRARVVVDHRSRPWVYDEFEDMRVNHSRTYIPDEDDEDRIREYFDPGYSARTPQCECDSCKSSTGEHGRYARETFYGWDNIDAKDLQQHSERKYLVCAKHVFGFVLKDRKYELLDVRHLQKARISRDAIDRLVMDPKTKDTIKAIVKTYTDASGKERFNADFIQGKGEGQIFLLHGGPGTGKTLTAESVAEYTGRPLLSISAADLGHDPTNVEENLMKFFKNAHDWDAIVLLDEADVYLASRTNDDLERNSIVSVFLRALDWISSILFLTTNRVGEFDEAFKSRIHLSIGYKDLDEVSREQIWTNLFTKLEDDEAKTGVQIAASINAKEYVKESTKLKLLRWNGREIRNAFQTAVALAIFAARDRDERDGNAIGTTIPKITADHLAQVVDMGTAFSDYLVKTRGGYTDQELADSQRLRFNETEVITRSPRNPRFKK